MFFFFLMLRRPPRSTRTDTLFPSTTPFRSRIKPCLLRGGFDALFRQLSSAIKRTVEAAIFALLGCIQTGLPHLPAFIAQYGQLAINHLQPFVLRQHAVNVGQAAFYIAQDIVEEYDQNDIAILCPFTSYQRTVGKNGTSRCRFW